MTDPNPALAAFLREGARETRGPLPRDESGRFFTRRCVDPNCDGELAWDDDWGRWRCNGLTHRTGDGPLEECAYSHYDGETRDMSHAR